VSSHGAVALGLLGPDAMIATRCFVTFGLAAATEVSVSAATSTTSTAYPAFMVPSFLETVCRTG